MADYSPWLLLNPLPLAYVGAAGATGGDRTLSPEPKEVAVTTGGETYIIYRPPAGSSVDTVFLGFTTPPPVNSLQVWSNKEGREAIFLGFLNPVARPGWTRGHALLHVAAPVPTDTLTLVNASPGSVPAGIQLGVFAAGRAFRSQQGYEFGHGRGVIDTGSATRRRDGGFGIQRGARAATWNWTLAELSVDETDRLHDLLLDIGESKTVLVCEDVAAAATNARVFHWSLLRSIEPYVRDEVALSRWGFQLQDWA
ncbi:hypothetical protein ASE73_02520 [Sphingomonas sp. Leaf24]|uniref:hypothetical protein n=1 Tax=unclassified Sphingomonas TaxID=196159 RepID=UPI0007000BB2|nr:MULTISPECIES: hypothetical protein [unclassified Sphingomonas]KQM23117.1 hypothetical protein ASE50_02520 [Sphingomonas sp. Leaf5]KQM95975.1 hypothetical protein ASE73_02520 [Sphingomonas sp. Leaf24]